MRVATCLAAHAYNLRAVPGIEPGTSPTLRENHATRPNSHDLNISTQTFGINLPPRPGFLIRCTPLDAVGRLRRRSAPYDINEWGSEVSLESALLVAL